MKSKITRNKIIAAIIVIIVLAGAFWYGGNAPGLQGWNISSESEEDIESSDDKSIEEIEEEIEDIEESEETEEDEEDEEDKAEIEEKDEEDKELEDIEKEKKLESRPGGKEGGMSASEKVKLAENMRNSSSPGVKKGSKDYAISKGMEIDPNTGKDKYLTDPVPEGKPIPVEPENTEITDKLGSCILSVRCDTILDNMDWLNPEKIELVPKDGVIFAKKTVNFYEGESVFNVLLREMKSSKIHMEFSNTPMYNSAYIEGINNLYEFDCGELSGWMYKVNNWFPNYGCSRYQVKEGDIIEWEYTCTLGKDIGGYSSVGGD